jgi:site-specific DNA-methyltransferase (adenine-specific)
MVRIINDDVLATNAIADNSIDLIVTSPPYNVDIPYTSHNDVLSYDDYLEFSDQWLTRCYSFLKDDGRMCLNIPLDKNKGGQQSVGADMTTIARKIGYQYHATIIWNEGNISRRTAWGSWMSASAPYVIAPVELIVVLYKQRWKKTSGSRKSDITREEFLDWTNGMWTFSGESKKKIGHPAPFPLELPERCMKLFSFVGDTVLDPFLGSGTTALVAQAHHRQAIGVEIDTGYCELAKERLHRGIPKRNASPLTVSGLVMEFFRTHPNDELRHGPVVDWVTAQWVKSHGTPPSDPRPVVRKLHQEGKLIKVRQGVYKYNPKNGSVQSLAVTGIDRKLSKPVPPVDVRRNGFGQYHLDED